MSNKREEGGEDTFKTGNVYAIKSFIYSCICTVIVSIQKKTNKKNKKKTKKN